jgi:hypothetical protein
MSFGSQLFGPTTETLDEDSLFLPDIPQEPTTPKSKPLNDDGVLSTSKRVRLTASGKVHAAARPITADLDEADRCIWSMKNDGASNSEVVIELRKLGINYDPKTVGTRHLRIKTVVARNGEMINGRKWTNTEV